MSTHLVLNEGFVGLTRVGSEKDSGPHLSKKSCWAKEVFCDSAFRLTIQGAETIIQKHNFATSVYRTGKSLTALLVKDLIVCR